MTMWIKSFIVLFLLSAFPILSDKLILKNGQEYENVKVRTVGTLVEILFEDGSKKTAPKKNIKSLKLKVVVWKNVINKKDAYEEERIRIAEFLIENSNWQPKEDEKPQLMILKFKAGKGITTYKADSLSNLIRTKVINTGVFVVVDRLTMEKEIEKNKCMDVNCSQNIASDLKVNKLLTGEISSTPNGYFITGEIIDIKQKKVEFSETILIPSEEKEETKTAEFAAKIAGGTLEQWEHPINNPQAGIQIIPYIWRSMVLPGWGQYEKEQYIRSVFYPVLLVAGAAYYKLASDQYLAKQSQYQLWTQLSFVDQSNTLSPFLFYFSEMQKKEANKEAATVNRVVSVLLGIYIVNIIDAIFTPVPMELKNVSFQYNQEIFRENNSVGKVYGVSYTFQF